MTDTPTTLQGSGGATARPWEAESEILHNGAHVAGRAPRVFKRGPGIGRTIARCVRSVGPSIAGADEEAEANAELIVRAVNAHDDLVAALRKCVSVFEQLADAGNYPLPLYQNGGWDFAVKALRKATERQS